MPTSEENEYITQKLKELRTKALKTSLQRTLPAIPKGGREDNLARTRKLKYDAEIAKYDMASDLYKHGKYIPSQFDNYSISGVRQVDPERLRIAALRRVSELENEATLYEKGVKCAPGASCIYTATDNYGKQYREASNRRFESNHDGFLRIPVSDVEPGDIVQSKNNGIPVHGMVFDSFDSNGTPRFNYSRGGQDSTNIVRKGFYTEKGKFNDDNFNAFRFVGTPADSLKWVAEYKQKSSN